ncbi:MAG: ribosome-associated translation inhibitor RaiA [Patescibacteria group bacterium]
MKITIKATNAKLTPEAHEIINKKIVGLLKYYNQIMEADVEVGITTTHHQKGSIYRAEVNLRVPKKTIRAEAETENITKSINQVRDILKKELVKYKELHQE